MHVYHFGVYETAALKRLMCRYATREDELDRLLRGGRFVDLHQVLRQGVRCSVERYGLKELEPFHGFARGLELREAAAALRQMEVWLEVSAGSGGGEVPAAVRERVRDYNREDCLSTEALRRWLEERRPELVAGGAEVARPEAKSGEAGEDAEKRRAEVQVVRDALLAGVAEDARERGEEEQARWLLAQVLDYFRRESKCAWWEFFRLRELEEEELLAERKAVAGLAFVGEVEGGTARCPVHRYEFLPQEASLSEGDELRRVGTDEDAGGVVGKVVAFDQARGVLDVRMRRAAAGEHPRALFVHDDVNARVLEDALLDLGRVAAPGGAAGGVDGDGPFRAARDLLLRRGPRLRGGARDPLQPEGCDVLARARELVGLLEGGLLAIQGPPGSGKTFTGARMVLELVRAGKRVGVTAVSHKVVRKFLQDVVAAARDEGVAARCVHKVSGRGGAVGEEGDGVEEVSANDAALDEGAVVGGTAWLWARAEARFGEGSGVDFLFVDEAGQMSLAHVLAVAVAAENLVLLGDPQQLEQPQQGAHPEGSDVAALVHLLDGAPTMPRDKGLFLDRTWRLHPAVCAFTSEVYYEGRLKTVDGQGLERQELRGQTPFAGAGPFFVPVEHEGNQSSSPEEVEVVGRVVEGLVGGGVTFVDRRGVERVLGWDDVLVVAPYNAQVAALQRRCPRMRVGTVDKFQGQEAPVVVYSMASSSPEDAPRGMAFLYNPNRLNVATSRAQCAVVLIGNPRLLEPECRTVEQMKWANGLCRFGEVGRVVRVAE